MIAKYRSFTATMTAGQATTFDFALTDTMLLRGLRIQTQNQAWDDALDLYLVDVDGVMFPKGTVLAQMAQGFPLNPDVALQIDMMVPDANQFPTPNLYLRCVYTSVGLVDVKFKAFVYCYIPLPPPKDPNQGQ